MIIKLYLLTCAFVIWSRTILFALEYCFEKSKNWCVYYGAVDNSNTLKNIKNEYVEDIKRYIPYMVIFSVVAGLLTLIF